MQQSWGLCAVIWLLHFLAFIQADSAHLNLLAHSYERMWLYEMYDLFCDIDGTYGRGDRRNKVPEWQVGCPRQEKLFGCWSQGYEKNKSPNKGTGRDNRLTFAEFQWRLAGNTFQNKGAIPPELPSDDSWKDVNNWPRLTEIMKTAGKGQFTGLIPLRDNGIMKDKKFYKNWVAPTDDKRRTPFVDLLERIQAEYTEARLDPGRQAKIPLDKKERLLELTDRIVQIRKAETQQFLADYFRDRPSKPGALPGAIIERKQSKIPGHPDYDKVDFISTIEKVYYKRGPQAEEIKTWANKKTTKGAHQYLFQYLYKNGVEGGIKFEDGAYSHRRVLTSWQRAYTENIQDDESWLAKCKRS